MKKKFIMMICLAGLLSFMISGCCSLNVKLINRKEIKPASPIIEMHIHGFKHAD
jgi:hypothetical protein